MKSPSLGGGGDDDENGDRDGDGADGDENGGGDDGNGDGDENGGDGAGESPGCDSGAGSGSTSASTGITLPAGWNGRNGTAIQSGCGISVFALSALSFCTL